MRLSKHEKMVLNVLSAMKDNTMKMADIFKKEGNSEVSNRCLSEAFAYEEAIWIIKNPKSLASRREIFADEIAVMEATQK